MILAKLAIGVLGAMLLGWLVWSEFDSVMVGEATLAGGHMIAIDGEEVSLWGIAAPPVTHRCVSGATEWPCGAHVLAAMMATIRGRTVWCFRKRTPGDAQCYATRNYFRWDDVARRLVEAGWAVPQSGVTTKYLELGQQAREARRGLWGPPPNNVAPGGVG